MSTKGVTTAKVYGQIGCQKRVRHSGVLDHGVTNLAALEEFLEGLPWAAVVVDRAGTIRFANAKARAHHPSQASPEGQKFTAVYSQYLRVLDGDEPWMVPQEIEYYSDDPDHPVVERLLVSRVGDDGCLQIIDETDLHEPDHERIQTGRLASLGFMLAGVCHEVSNPLAATYSMVQILQSQKELSEETLRKGLDNIAANVKRILEVSRKLNDFSRVGDSGRRTMRVDFPIQEAISLLRSDMQFDGLDIQQNPDPNARVRGQAGALQQIFYNLALNAAQAMGGCGTLVFNTRTLPGPRVLVTVEDTGPGIPAEVREKIFEPFFTTKRDGGGTGLGLAITWEIVQEHDGTIEVNNKTDGGACFTIEFPGESKAS
jgi:two-component system NtrC family sensor kinase